MITVDSRILENSYTSAQWATSNPVLPDRVLGYDTTVRKYKMGNGVSTWSILSWWSDMSLPPQTTVDIPIGTVSPFTYSPSSDYGNTPTMWVELYRSESPVITEDYVTPIQRTYASGVLTGISIDFGGTTTDHFRLVIKG